MLIYITSNTWQILYEQINYFLVVISSQMHSLKGDNLFSLLLSLLQEKWNMPLQQNTTLHTFIHLAADKVRQGLGSAQT